MVFFPKRLKYSCCYFIRHAKRDTFSVIVFLLLFFLSPGAMAQYFTPGWQGGAYNPMTIIISGASLDSLDLEAGDEVGLFDNWQCVGAAVLQQNIDPENDDTYLYITCSEDDPDSPQQDGFAVRNTEKYRVCEQCKEFEFLGENAGCPFLPAFAVSDFYIIETSVVELSALSSISQSPA